MDILTALQTLTSDLTTAGFRATLDGQDLNPPGVYVTLGNIDTLTLCGGGELQALMYLVVGDLPESRAIAALNDLLGPFIAAVAALGLPITDPISPDLVQPASGGSPLPALKITTTLTV